MVTLTPTPILAVEIAPDATPYDAVALEIQHALRLLHVTENGVCWEAARRLGRIGPEAIPALIPILKEEENEEVRGAAAYALGEMRAAATLTVPALIQALEDEEDIVRTITAEALGKIGPGAVEAVPALTKTMMEGAGGHFFAVYALGKIGPGAMKAVPALIEMLEHHLSQDMDAAVYYALVQITGQDFRYDADAWQQW
ncbi:MAG TPA: HEAT repeat domain-containing protein [Anaerolineae bacterium]|nr:HEAT repeat domain-containing protein [Anaerolineae bacterium]HQI83342.1 HEAT repeat domain-containing protein [Anaerolineae bacterium]